MSQLTLGNTGPGSGGVDTNPANTILGCASASGAPFVLNAVQTTQKMVAKCTHALAGSQKIRLALYTNNGGVPGTLVAVTNEVTISSANAPTATLIDFPFASPVTLPAQAYWIVAWFGPVVTNQADISQDVGVSGTSRYNVATTYSTGSNPPSTFPTPTAGDNEYVAYAVLDPIVTTIPPASSLTDANGDVWTIVSGQVAKNGVVDTSTSGVVELAYVSGSIWQKNSVGNWYRWLGTAWGPPTTVDPTAAGDVARRWGFSNGYYVISAADMARAVAIGAKWIRTDLSWWAVENTRGAAYNWSASDAAMANAISAGAKFLPCLGYAPPWAWPAGAAGQGNSGPTSTYFPDFANFCAAAVTRYAPQGVTHFEIFNEPNLTTFWGVNPSPANYTAMLQQAYTAMKAAAAALGIEIIVITAGLAPVGGYTDSFAQVGNVNVNQTRFIEGIYAAGGAGYFDAIGIHLYNRNTTPTAYHYQNALSQLEETPVNIRGLMTAAGDGAKLIHATESGVESTLINQTNWINEVVPWWGAKPYAGIYAWYLFREGINGGGTDFAAYGLRDTSNNIKPGWTTYASQIAALGEGGGGGGGGGPTPIVKSGFATTGGTATGQRVGISRTKSGFAKAGANGSGAEIKTGGSLTRAVASTLVAMTATPVVLRLRRASDTGATITDSVTRALLGFASRVGSDPYAGGASLAFGAPASTSTSTFAVFADTFDSYTPPDNERSAYYARLPIIEAQRMLGLSGADAATYAATSCSWHGQLIDPERGSFILARAGSAFEDRVGQRVVISSRTGSPPLSVVGFVHGIADLDPRDDLSVPRRLFMQLAPLGRDRVSVAVETLR